MIEAAIPSPSPDLTNIIDPDDNSLLSSPYQYKFELCSSLKSAKPDVFDGKLVFVNCLDLDSTDPSALKSMVFTDDISCISHQNDFKLSMSTFARKPLKNRSFVFLSPK